MTDLLARVAEARRLEGTLLDGRFRVRGVLGVGGAAQVLRATDERTGADVAIKLLDASLAQNAEVVARFAREARAASALDSAHVVRVLESGHDDAGRPFLVMELVRGEDLGARLARLSKLPLDETVDIVLQIVSGLVDAHGAGVVHRDLKPDNVLVEERAPGQFRVKITDFGMAKVAPQASFGLSLTREGLVVGTPLYMAPEQVRALPDVDGRADVWSVGAILFECITGRPPFLASSQEQAMIDVCTKDAPDVRAVEPRVPRELAKVIGRALARDREQRFPSALALRDALLAAWPAGARERRSFGARDSRPSGGASPAAAPAWHQRPVVLAALALGGLAAGLGFVLALLAALR